MALSDSATAQLWETFRASGGAGLIREAVELVLQELIEAEAAEAVGVGRYERSEARTVQRNGHRPRLLATQAGDLELKIPKLRKGSFMPSMLEPRRRIDRALWAVIMEAYVAGVSTRSVDDLVAALGAESGISKSEVSRICAGLDEGVGGPAPAARVGPEPRVVFGRSFPRFLRHLVALCRMHIFGLLF